MQLWRIDAILSINVKNEWLKYNMNIYNKTWTLTIEHE